MPQHDLLRYDWQIVRTWSLLLTIIGAGFWWCCSAHVEFPYALGAIGYLLCVVGVHALALYAWGHRHTRVVFWVATLGYISGFLVLMAVTGGLKSPVVVAYSLFPLRLLSVSRSLTVYVWSSLAMSASYLAVGGLFTPELHLGVLLIHAMILLGLLKLMWYTYRRFADLLAENAGLIQSLQRQNEELVRAGRTKSQLLSQVSHELRNPLSIITSYSELLQEGLRGPLPGPVKSDIQLIASSAQQLSFMVDDLLDLNRAELKQLKIALQPVPLVPLLDELMAAIQPAAGTKGLRVSFECAYGPTRHVAGDPVRLKQVFHNILSNALKFTDQGDIAVTYQEQIDNAVVTVVDTGIGMAPEVLEQIYTPFTVSSANRQRGGAGLGLAIVKRLVDLHRGEILIASKEGTGTRVTLVLPLWEEP